MKFFALLCVVGFAAASTVGHSQVQWQDGHEYTFKYEGRLLSGLPELQSQYSGLGMKCNVHLQVRQEGNGARRFNLRLSEPQYTEVNQILRNEDQSQVQKNWRTVQLPTFNQVSGEARQQLDKPTSFILKSNGEFESMAVSDNEPEWSINFKKAIIILFQTKFQSMELSSGYEGNMSSDEDLTMITWTTSEEGLDGNCQVDYQLNEVPEAKADQLQEFFSQECRNGNTKRYELVKTRNIDSCSQRSSLSFYKPGFHRCSSGNCNGQWTRSSITRYFACGSNAESLKIQTIVNEGELQQDLLGERTEKFLTGNRQVLRLVQKSSGISSHISLPSNSVTVQSPAYVHISEGQQGQQQGLNGGLEQNSPIMPRQIITAGYPGDRESYSFDIKRIQDEIKKVVHELVKNDLPNPVKLNEKDVSLKAINLARAFSTLKYNEIEQVYNDIVRGGQGEEQESYRNILIDTIIMGGTRDCVLFISHKIQSSSDVAISQQLSFFMFMPQYLVTPTQPLLEELYRLVRSSKVQNNKWVQNQAVLSYSSLIQKACLSQNRRTSYPSNVLGEFCSPNSEIVVGKWIPYLQQQVYQSISREHSVENRNLHLVALGLLRHRDVLPTIMQLIEEQESQDSAQNRLTRYIAVYSLSRAGWSDSRKAVQALHAILKNQSERPEVRIAAFNGLMKLNADLHILQSIASMTWRENNKEVRNVINSAFITLAHKKDIPVLDINESSLRRKASLVAPLLKWSRGLSSGTIYTADRLPMLDVSYLNEFSWTSTKHNLAGVIPSNFHSRMVYLLNRYQYTAYEGGARIEGFENLIQQLVEILVPDSVHKTKNSVGQKIVEKLSSEWRQVIQKLNIKNRNNEQSSVGSVFLNVMEDMTFFQNFESTSSDMLREKITSLIGESPKEALRKVCGDRKVNMQRMINFAPAEYMVPSDMGFPIIIQSHSPMTVSLKGRINVDCNSRVPHFESDLTAFVSGHYIGLVGTVSPFSKQFLSVGVDEKSVLNLPARFKTTFEMNQQEIRMTVSPSQRLSQGVTLVHHRIQPYTATQKVYNLEPVTRSGSGFKPIRQRVPQNSNSDSGKVRIPFGEKLGLKMDLTFATDSRTGADLVDLVRKFSFYNYDLKNLIHFPFVSTAVSRRGYPSIRYHEIKINYSPQESTTQEIDFVSKIGLGSKIEGESAKYTMIKRSEELKSSSLPLQYPGWQNFCPVKIVSERLGQYGQHTERQHQLREVLEKMQIQSGSALVFDNTVTFKGSEPRTYKCKVTIGSGLEQLSQKWNIHLHTENQKYCVKGHIVPAEQLPSMDIESLRENPIRFNFENVISYGQNECSGSSIRTDGYFKTSVRQIEYSKVSEEAKQYNELKSKNSTLAKISKIASVVREQATILDEAKFDIKVDNVEKAKKYTLFINSLLKSIWWPNVKDSEFLSGLDTRSYSGESESTVSDGFGSGKGSFGNNFEAGIFLQVDGKTNTFNATLNIPTESNRFAHIQMPYYMAYFAPSNGLSSIQTLKGQSSPSMRHSKCEISGNLLKTFEKRLIPHSIDDCFHVVAADCSFKKSFSVLARSVERQNPKGDKEVKIISGYTTILLTPGSGHSSYSSNLNVRVNGSEISLPSSSKSPKYVKDNKGDLIATIYKTQEGGIEVSTVYCPVTKQNSLTVKYFGSFSQILVSSAYKGETCGTCGEMTGDMLSSLRGPKKCLYSKPQLLVASYRVSTQEKQCGSLEQTIKQELEREQEQCHKKTLQSSQVEKSYQAAGGKCVQHINEVIQNGDNDCFSKYPIVRCGSECRPKDAETKTVEMVCLPRDSALAKKFEAMIARGEIVEQLKNMPATARLQQELPRTCVPKRS